MNASRLSRQLLLFLSLGLFLSSSPLRAHTRERKRIDALEIEMAKRDAVVAARLKSLSAENERLTQALEARREHGRRLDARLKSLEDGLRRAAREAAKDRATLRREAKEDAKDRLEGQRQGSLERKVLRQGIENLSQGAKVQNKAIELQSKALKDFRKSLADYGKEVDGTFQSLGKRVNDLQKQLSTQDENFKRRLADLLEVLGDENRKLRKAIDGLNRVPTEPGIHVVQPGENLYGIARSYGLSSEELRKANPELEEKKWIIHPGDRLHVPAGR